MRPLNIAVYLVAVLHAMDVDPELAAAVGQHGSTSSRAAAVDSQVSDTHFVYPSESRLLRGEASASEQAGVGLDVGPLIELSHKDMGVVKFVKDELKLKDKVDVENLAFVRAIPINYVEAKPINYVEAVGPPHNALKSSIDRMKRPKKMKYHKKLLANYQTKKQPNPLRKLNDKYKKKNVGP
ncbi:unnamed protein product [Hyaloperonospora brassicae]|uniref:RxLR effector protein n=1 Tax=Hyaloperonospora brassicae TaxID=162125 RepID=A0AAV0TKU6_HYABA|nr:unnamed protein product [Hyaloperonospora brassicae]